MLNGRAPIAKRFSPPARLFALVLLVFCVEMAFMFVFAGLLREQRVPVWGAALLDVVLLTAVASAGAWWLLVRPLQAALSTEAAHAKAVLDATAEAIITTDDRGMIIGFNRAAERMFGYDRREVMGKDIALFVNGARPRKHERFVSWFLAASHGKLADAAEWVAKRKDRTEVPVEVNVTAVRHAGAHRYTCFIRDIAERKRVEESTRMLAYHDTLTGLPNRALFYDRLRQSIVLGKRHRQRFALLYVDLDGFKAVNDQWGHDAGDYLLKSAAQRVRGLLRESDTVARMGGDEFIVILARSGGRAAVGRVARKIIKAMSEPFALPQGAQQVTVGASIGIAIYPDGGDDIDGLVKRADAAMYQAKRTGGTFHFSGQEDTDRPTRRVP